MSHRDGMEPWFSGSNRGRVRALALVVAGVSCWLVLAGCGGGMQNNPPPPTPAFTTIDAPGAGPQGTFAYDINATAEVVGFFYDSSGVVHSFTTDSSGTVTAFDPPGTATQPDFGSTSGGINGSGTSVGAFDDQQLEEHGFLRSSGGTFTTIDPPGSVATIAGCINDAGTVAGGFRDVSGLHGYVWTGNGAFTIFDPSAGTTQLQSAIVNRMNASGAVTGYFVDMNGVAHGFLLSTNGTVTVLDATGAGTASGEGTQTLDINSSGAIVGWITTGTAGGVAVNHSFIRAANGTYTIFDLVQAGPNGSLADRITDDGAIIGDFLDANLVRHGYLRNSDGTFVILDDPNAAQLPASATNLGTVPRAINASGIIAGLYSDAAGTRHGFIWQ